MEYIDTLATPQNSECNLDIVFVHGLNPKGDLKHARKTWTHENGTFWPETLLPELLPTARILLFGYNSSVLSNASNVPAAGHAQSLLNDVNNQRLGAKEIHRPLIFISHSLGGLLVTQALVEARLNERYRCLKASTYGLVFFATPHAGGNMAGIANFASKVCSVLTGEPSSSLLATLEKNSLLNEISSDQFNHQMNDFEILSFYEGRKMDVKVRKRRFRILRGLTSMYIVDRSSAKLGFTLPLDRNHSEICKFSGREDRVWERVSPNLNTMGIKAQKTTVNCNHAPAEPSCATTPYYIIPPRNRKFTGRTKQMKELEEKLIISDDCQKLALVGLGGIGKTEVALELAYTLKERGSGYSIFCVPAVSLESFQQAYGAIATICSIPLNPTEDDPQKLVKRYLESNSAGKWLLIVDNLDDKEVLFGTPTGTKGVIDHLPESENGLTLLTTRNREIAVHLASSDVVELQEMNHEEAEKFLKKSLTQKELVKDQMATTELLNELTYLPLAIAQAAAYLNMKQSSIKDYLIELRETEEGAMKLLSEEFRDSTRYNNTKIVISTATTWLVSFNQIRQSDPEAADLLSFVSCIENKAIPRLMLPSMESAQRAIGTLRGYAFVTKRGDDDSYDMHRLVHLATKVWLRECGTTEELNEKVAARLAEIFPPNDWSNRAIWRKYFPHALQFLRNSEALDSSTRYDLCMAVGKCLLVDGRAGEAVVWLHKCVLWRQKHFAKDHRSRLASQHTLAMAYQANGQVKNAVKLLEHVVAIKETVLKEDHPSRLASQHVLAGAYQANGQVKDAVKLLEHVVAIEETVLKEDHPDRLASQHELAGAYQANGQVKDAVKLLEHVVAIQETVLKEDHPSRLASQHMRAIAYQANGQVKDAVKLLEHVVAIRETVLMEDHPDRLASQHTLAIAYQANGQVKDAVKLLEHVVAIRETVLMEDHPDRLASQHTLAIAYQANGQVKDAVKLLEHVVAIQETVLKEDHPSRLASQHMRAIAYQANGQVKNAVKLLEHVVAIQETVLKEDHPSRLASQHALLSLYAQQLSDGDDWAESDIS